MLRTHLIKQNSCTSQNAENYQKLMKEIKDDLHKSDILCSWIGTQHSKDANSL